MCLSTGWMQTAADGLLRADQVIGIAAHQTPELTGKPARWLLDVILPVAIGSGIREGWGVPVLHRTLIQTADDPGPAAAALARLLAQRDLVSATGVIATGRADTRATAPVDPVPLHGLPSPDPGRTPAPNASPRTCRSPPPTPVPLLHSPPKGTPVPMSISLPDLLLALLRAPNPCFIATIEPDGAPQLTQTWIDTDGTHVLLNTVEGHRKLANMARDPRVAINVCDRTALDRNWVLRGHVLDTTPDGAADHIQMLSQRYTGGPYQNYGGSQGGRVLVRIAIDKIVQQPW